MRDGLIIIKKRKQLTMNHLKKFNEGFNDNSEELCLPLGITVSQFKAMYVEKMGKEPVEEELQIAIEYYYDLLQRSLEEEGIDLVAQLDSFFKFHVKKSQEATVFPELEKLIKQIWDGDVDYETAVEDFTKEEIALMNATIKKNPTMFKDGVPFEGDDEIFDEMLENDKGTQLIQKMVDNLD